MKCSELQGKYSAYVDRRLSEAEVELVRVHLVSCPVCRIEVDEIRDLKASLSGFGRPEVPRDTVHKVRLAVRAERSRNIFTPLFSANFDWIQMRLMPLSVGIVGSVVVGISFMTLLMSGGLAINDFKAKSSRSDARIMISSDGSGPQEHDPSDISPIEYASNRRAIAGESPSINPRGTLATISGALARNGSRNNEVVVVADVFSNGLAKIAEVVEPSSNIRAVEVIERALDSDSPNAPFVPAAMDHRANNVRVVLKFQSVEVNSRPLNKKR